jgi:hypothetical protein
LTGICPKGIADFKSKSPYSAEGDRLILQLDRQDGLKTEIVYERVRKN